MARKTYRSLVAKIRLLLMGALAVPFLVTAFSIGSSVYININFRQILKKELAVMKTAETLARNAVNLRLTLLEFDKAGSNYAPLDSRKAFVSNFKSLSKRIKNNAKTLENLLPGTDYSEKSLKELNESMEDFKSYEEICLLLFDDVLNNPQRSYLETSRYISYYLNDVRENMYSFESTLLAIATTSDESLNENVDILISLSRKLSFISSIAFIVVIGLVFIYLSITLARMKKNFKEIVFQVKDLSSGEGDLTKVLPIITKDEFGELSRYMNQFVANLKELVLQMKITIKEGFSISHDLKESSSNTSESLDRIQIRIGEIQEMAQKFSEESEQVTEHFKRVESFIGEVNQLIDNQAADIEESSSAIAEMTSSINSVQSSMKIKVDLADDLRKVAQEGQNKMSGTMEDIRKISLAAQSILDMVKIINKIASQTNLLAMNAAIEAAHAGDAGSGFSVVADEIRKLSEGTTINAKNINTELSGIVSIIQLTDESAGATSESFEVIVKRIGLVADGIREMGQTLTEISQGNAQINQSLSSLVSSAGSLKTSSSEMFQMTGEISGLLSEIDALSGRTREGVNDIGDRLYNIQQAGQISAEAGIKNSNLFNKLDDMGQRFKVIDEKSEEEPS